MKRILPLLLLCAAAHAADPVTTNAPAFAAVDSPAWVAELPADRFVRTVRGREMYLIIPADKDSTVTVREMLYDKEHFPPSRWY